MAKLYCVVVTRTLTRTALLNYIKCLLNEKEGRNPERTRCDRSYVTSVTYTTCKKNRIQGRLRLSENYPLRKNNCIYNYDL